MIIESSRGVPADVSFSPLTGYFMLRDEIDNICRNLEETHKEHIVCSAGCHQCCMNFNIFPVEFYAILEELKRKEIRSDITVPEGECVFLIKGLCSIYDSRPIICRTHGLPLLQMGEDDWQLTYCELNFTRGKLPEFCESNTFAQDRFNSKLFMINREFIKTLKSKIYSETDLIPLREIGTKNGVMT